MPGALSILVIAFASCFFLSRHSRHRTSYFILHQVCAINTTSLTPCNVDSIRECYDTKLRSALAIAVENERSRVHKASELGILSGLDENGCFDELEMHGYDHVERRKLLGNATVQFNLGVYFFTKTDAMAEDVEEGAAEEEKSESSSKEKAAKWFRRAAMQGHAKAQCNLGYMYLNGLVFKRNESDAALWYATAKEVIPETQHGHLWDSRVSIPDDVWSQVKRFDDTANASHRLAKTNIGAACGGCCLKECKKGNVPKKALINGTWTGTVPDELRNLTSVEISMISVYNSITMLTMLPSGACVVVIALSPCHCRHRNFYVIISQVETGLSSDQHLR